MSLVPPFRVTKSNSQNTSQFIIHLAVFNYKTSVIKGVVKYNINIKADSVSLEIIRGKGKCVAITRNGRHRGDVEV